jgi:ActR/RegA family two-component response regulator
VEREGVAVAVAHDQESAIRALQTRPVTVLLLDLMLRDGSAFAVADYAGVRDPDIRILFVTPAAFFSDGSIFQHVANARAYLPLATPPNDLAVMVGHYAARS